MMVSNILGVTSVFLPCTDSILPDLIEIIITNRVAYTSSSNGLPVQKNIVGTKRIVQRNYVQSMDEHNRSNQESLPLANERLK